MVATQFTPSPLPAQTPLLVKYTIFMGCASVSKLVPNFPPSLHHAKMQMTCYILYSTTDAIYSTHLLNAGVHADPIGVLLYFTKRQRITSIRVLY